MREFGDAYRGKRVLLTGHTGFKGSWLALWLQRLGAHVTGIGLAPDTSPSHWALLRLKGVDDRCVDVRDAAGVAAVFAAARPDVVFHLAAQSLVRRSYRNPLETWSTNVMGTASVLDACRGQPSVRAIVVVTTDKCYENLEWDWSYREVDRLGGHDPYSASKAATELVASSYRDAFFHQDGAPLLASARAGNVIGGGDWSEDRLIPDIVRAVAAKSVAQIRSPQSTRPWQHVLEPLSGYLLVGQKLLEGHREFGEPWNFGPADEGNRTVGEVLTRLQANWPAMQWRAGENPQLHEAKLLHLDSSKARRRLQWKPAWGLEQCLAATSAWYRVQLESGAPISARQLDEYIDAARGAGVAWAS